MNATARFHGGKLDIWTGSQFPGMDAILAAEALGIETEAVRVHVAHLGGGFGRRAIDAPLYAALLAREAEGRPVKVTWSREEDMTHDFYRPRALARLRAVVEPGKGILALDAHVASQSPLGFLLGATFPSIPAPPDDDAILDGLFNQPLALPASRFAAHPVTEPVPVGFWRSVGNSQNGFFHEAFLDEVAEKAGMDPFDLRLAHMNGEEHRPARLVLEELRKVSGWQEPPAEGRARGMAFCLSFGTWVGQVVEITALPEGIRVERVTCVADPGLVLDPRNFRAQMVSAIVYGLSAALGQKITFADGMVEQTNFDTFDALRMAQCPRIDVHLLENAPKMGGAGEPGLPPVAPALANAIHRATGQRLRSMPFTEGVAFV